MADMAIHPPPEKIVEDQLDERIQKIESILMADVVTFYGSILYGIEDFFQNHVELMARSEKRKKKLVIILETDSGYIEVVERIAKYFDTITKRLSSSYQTMLCQQEPCW